jgi:hypothetical protein
MIIIMLHKSILLLLPQALKLDRRATNIFLFFDEISSTQEAVNCIYCSKTGHGAQTCEKLISWLAKHKSFHQKKKKTKFCALCKLLL